jgi:hypothetical protein
MPKKNRDCRFAGGNRAATVCPIQGPRESVQARVPGIDKGKLKIAHDFDKMSKSELAAWYGPGTLLK